MNQIKKAVPLLWRTALNLSLLIIALGAIDRVVMICITGPSELSLSFWQYLGAFVIGAVNDLAFAILSMVFLWLYIVSAGEWKYRKPTAWCILGLLAAVEIYVTWFCPSLHEFNRGLARVVSWVLLYWIVTFALRLFIPRMRRGWTRCWLAAILFIYVAIMYMNAAGEYFFWDEFAVRYNFIAVDYLVYTNEVVGNIMESYPMVPLILGVVLISGLTTWWLFGRVIKESDALYERGWKLRVSGVYIAGAALSFGFLTFSAGWQHSDNMYYNELQANGPYRFFDAFFKNTLDYKQFYTCLPDNEAERLVQDLYGSADGNRRMVPGDSTERHPNIVLVTMESMSGDYMARFGNTENLTPVLDSLYTRSVAFDRMFANGNRTVRGLEALTLSIPPSAGQSLIKRSDLKNRPNIGGVLRDKGYATYFFYGGKSYFDNMGPYFRSIGFNVVDKDNMKPEEIEFSHIWGVCDEDSYSKMLTTLDSLNAKGKPFYAQMMTISNHRPYTYPDGRIDIPSSAKSRKGGVKYADYALGRFMREAAQKPWFNNTVFVIIADHCASSAGDVELPLEKYHIPALIYAPDMFQPRIVDYTVSQIDIMPTLLAMLGIGYESPFYGRNVLDPDYKPRAFLATYQDLGYLEGDTLTVLSPVRRVRQYVAKPTRENPYNTVLIEKQSPELTRKAAALYQTSAKWND